VPTFIPILFSLRIGLASASLEQAALSIRQETLAVAVESAERQRYLEEVAGVNVRRQAVAELGWRAPARYRLTREDWIAMIERSLSNEKVANTVAWLATQPVHVSVSDRRYFVSLRFSGP
jgi:hypothetical protein